MIGCGSSSRKTRTRGFSTATTRFVSAVITQDSALGVAGVAFLRTKQHPDHGDETGQGDGARHRDDDDVAPEGARQMVFHDAPVSLALRAFGGNLRGRDQLTMVAPRSALEIDDGGDVV